MGCNLLIDWQKYETKFNGHAISMELRPLKRWANTLLTPIYQESKKFKAISEKLKNSKKKDEDVPDDAVTFPARCQEIGEKIFPDHVRNITGITINNREMTVEDLYSESIFTSLAMDVLAELTKMTQINKDETKN